MIEMLAGLTGRARLTGERLVLSLVAYLAIGVLLASAYVALMVALGLFLSSLYGPIAASLVIAGVTIATAVIVMMMVRVRDRRLAMRSRLLAQRSASAASASTMAALLPFVMKASPLGALVAAGAAAYFMSRPSTSRRREG